MRKPDSDLNDNKPFSPESTEFLANFEYEYSSELNGMVITKYKGNEKAVLIPDTIGGKFVVSISGVKSSIPGHSTIITIGAFSRCTGLTSILIPKSVTSIGEFAFNGCADLTNISIPKSLTIIGEGAFSRCTGLTSILIPKSVISIGAYAFNGCASLTSISIPESVTIIGRNAFNGCTGLTSISMLDGVTSIGEFAMNLPEARPRGIPLSSLRSQ